MGDTYLRGSAIALLERFYFVDPLSGETTAANPDAVTFLVENPDGETQTFVYGVSPRVTNPEFGLFLLALDPQIPPGKYAYRVEATGNVEAVAEGSFDVIESGVLEPAPSQVASPGPCSSWISGTDVAAFDPTIGVGSAVWELDDVAVVASGLMYELSGRQFPGVCQKTVRPCRDACSCWGGGALGFGPFFWSSSAIAGWGWWNREGVGGGGGCGCGTESYLRLSGYPVREILEVKIDGTILDPSEYRLDQRRFLIRTADLTTDPPTDRFWPACQDLSLPDTVAGTYSVEYTYGADVPLLGRWAAAQLAAELWKVFPGNQGDCRLPSRVTKVARAGVTMERLLPTAELLRSGGTGLQLVDSFIAMVNPKKLRRRAAVWSPDVQRFGRGVGQ